MAAAAKARKKVKTHFHKDTPEEIKEILERARANHSRVRLFFGDTNTGRDWLEESDVTGTVGRSTGSKPILLLIANSQCLGGSSILCHCIVRILVGHVEKYRHPEYHLPRLEIFEASTGMQELGYLFSVKAHRSLQACFKTREQAECWVAFMKGERLNK
jgi:hypothetical protein